MLKKDLRAYYSQLRQKLPSKDILNSSLAIANNLLKLPIWSFDNYHIFLTISEKKEIDTSFILSILQGKDKNVILPKVHAKKLLKHYLLTDNTKLKESNWGIPEPMDGFEIKPEVIDVVFIPLLSFDKAGNRLGYGKGFYDRFLNECKPETIKIGLSLFAPEESITDISATDIPLNYCVTPSTTYTF